jgi:hypothetical protein
VAPTFFRPKGIFRYAKVPQGQIKVHFMLVLGFDLNLIVSRKTIHERKDFAACTFIDNLIDKRGWEIVFRAGLIQITEVHTNMNHALFLVDRNQVRHPFRQLYRVDKTDFEQFFYFCLDCCRFSRIDRRSFCRTGLASG